MAYRETEKVIASREAKRSLIIASAIDIIAKHGIEALNTGSVAERAGMALGVIYKHFPDKNEVLAAVVAQRLALDLAAIREAARDEKPVAAFENGIWAWMTRLAGNYRLMSAIAAEEAYRASMRGELAKMIKATGAADSPAILAAMAYGAVLEVARSGPRSRETLTTALLRALGVPAGRRERVAS